MASTQADPPPPEAYEAPIRDLGLESYVGEIKARGYTIVPPEVFTTPEFLDRVRAALLRVAEKRTGVKFHLDQNGGYGINAKAERKEGSMLSLFYILFEDPVFEDWLENPVMSAIVNYFLKGQGHLCSYTSFIKWRDADNDPKKWIVQMHADGPNGPDGKLLCGGDLYINSALCLTEYTKENGCIWMVPGSNAGEKPDPETMIPIEAPAGSLIFFKTWHGSRAKTTDGLRVTLTTFFTNRVIKPIDRYQGVVPKEMLDRHSAQFASYVHADDSSYSGIEGPQPHYFDKVQFW